MDKKIIVITGSATGLGKAIALELAGPDCVIVVNYRKSEQQAKEVLAAIWASGGDAIAYQCDVTDYAKVNEMIVDIIRLYGRIDVLINNAGITKDKLLVQMEEADFEAVIQVNLNGTFNTCKHVIKYMLKQKAGVVLNIASVSGIYGNVGQVNYAAAKAGLTGLTKSLAKEVGRRGIRVNALAPGFIQTEMLEQLPEQKVKELEKSIILRRTALPAEIARVAAFLVSDGSSYMTGQIICADGGLMM